MTGEKCRCQIVGWTRDPYEPHIPSQREWEQADDCPVHPFPTPVPSEVAETTAGEREVEALAKVIERAENPLDDGSPVSTYGELARAVLASDWLAALLDRVRREEGEKVLREAATDYARGPDYFDRHSATARWLRGRAASVGRGEGL